MHTHVFCLSGRTAPFSKPAVHVKHKDQWCSSSCLSHSVLLYSLSLPVPSSLIWAAICQPTYLGLHSARHNSCYFKAKYNESDGLHQSLALELLLVKSGLDKPSMEQTMLIKHLHALTFLCSCCKHQIHQDQSIFPSKTQSFSPHCS